MSFSIACCLGVIGGSGFVVMVSESVIGVVLYYLPTPPTPIYFIGKGDDKVIITDMKVTKTVTAHGDNKIASSAPS